MGRFKGIRLVLALAMSSQALSEKLPFSAMREKARTLKTSRFLEDYEFGEAQENCELFAGDDRECFCAEEETGAWVLNCSTACESCSYDYQTCGMESYSAIINGGPEVITSYTFSFQYSGDRTELISINDYDCNLSLSGGSCSQCRGFVDDQECNSCEQCDSFGGWNLDCENIEVGASFSVCDFEPSDGLFDFFDYGNTVCNFTAPQNDACEDASLLPTDGILFLGTLFGATPDILPECINYEQYGSPGVWFDVVGTGNLMFASACNSQTFVDVVISVFTGSCNSLQCVTEDLEQEFFCSNFYPGGTASWPSEEGVLYHILVNSLYDGTTDDFALSLLDISEAENDSCESATDISSESPIAAYIVNDFSYQTKDPCGAFRGPFVWYRVEALSYDAVLHASTCSDTTDIYTGIAIAAGDCDALNCIAHASPFDPVASCGDGGNRVEWTASAGIPYYIVVSGDDYDRGFFELSVRELTPPENDECINGIPLQLDGMTVEGSALDANQTYEEIFPSCHNYFDVVGGVWYVLEGTGGFIQASTCSSTFGHMISVYSGSCDNLDCVATSSSNYECYVSYDQGYDEGATVSWGTETGLTYFILVRGFDRGGTFELTLSEFFPPGNDDCFNATGLIEPNGELIIGSSDGAVADDAYSCLFDAQVPGVWYSVVGTGDAIRADTCSPLTDFDTELSIYRGTCGDALECIGGNDDGCDYFSSMFQWIAEEGVTYYIKVHGFSGNTGGFGLTVKSFNPPPNDECSGADEILTGDFIEGSGLSEATSENVLACDLWDDGTPGVWYYVEGTDTVLRALACSPDSGLYGSLTVFSGACNDLYCESKGIDSYEVCGNNDNGISASWKATEGQRYYILVRVNSRGSDTFNLNIAETDAAENNFCEDATSIPSISRFTFGSTTEAIPVVGLNNNYCLWSFSSSGVWYSIVGTGDVLSASTCSPELNFDSAISIFQGSCEELDCLITGAFNDYPCYDTFNSASKAVWPTERGVTYYILVYGVDQYQVGDFALSFETIEVPDNDVCSGALLIPSADGALIVGSTELATRSGFESDCGSYGDSQDLWYTIRGSGADLTASLCHYETTFDTVLAVYSGFSCDALSCARSNDDSCGSVSSEVSWLAYAGVTYFIRVSGYGQSVGSFGMTVSGDGSSSGVDTSNDACEDALDFRPGTTMRGSTTSASPDPLFARCGGATAAVGSGVWYVVNGDGNTFEASTCDGADFDTQISVFRGDTCDVLECVDGNDQACGSQSRVEWNTTPRAVYYILVHGWLSSFGDFRLSLNRIYEDDNFGDEDTRSPIGWEDDGDWGGEHDQIDDWWDEQDDDHNENDWNRNGVEEYLEDMESWMP